MPVLCFSKQDVAVYNLSGLELTSLWISEVNVLKISGGARWVICRWGAIPVTFGLWVWCWLLRLVGRVLLVRYPRNPLSRYVLEILGGCSGFRRTNGFRRQICRYPLGFRGVPPGPRERKAW